MKNATKLMLMLILFVFSASTVFSQVDAMPDQERDGTIYLNYGKAPAVEPVDSKALVYSQDFEGAFPPAGWSTSTAVSPGWQQSNIGYGYTGNYAAWQSWIGCGFDNWLISPVMDFTTDPLYQMSYYQMGNDVSYHDFYEVAVTTDGGSTWTTVSTDVAPEDSYEMIQIDLSAFAGNLTVQIGFHYQGCYADDWWIDDFLVETIEPGNVWGYVFNGGGLTIAGATVGAPAFGTTTTTDPYGYFELYTIPAGPQEIAAGKDGYITTTHIVNIPSNNWVQQDFILLAPTMIISPTFHEYTLNPGEYFTTQTGILNTGDGELNWEAAIIYPVTDVDGNAMSKVVAVNDVEEMSLPVTSMDIDPDIFGKGDGGPSDAFVECPPGSIFDNPPTPTSGSWAAGVSADAPGYLGAQKFTGLSDPIGSASFHGLSLSNPWAPCDEDPKTFRIDFYEDDALPTTLYASYVVESYRTVTGEAASGFPIYEWNVSFPSVDLTDGFISIVETDDGTPSCWFLWWNSDGNTGGFQYNAGWSAWSYGAFNVCLGAGGSGDWLTLDYYDNTVPPFGGLDNVNTNFNAAGTAAGEIYTADIVFTSVDPYVGAITLPCTMIIAGDPIVPPTDLTVELIDDIAGEVELNWAFATDAFQFFIVKRDGVQIGTSTETTYTDMLPDYGTYCYTVQSFYDEGYSTETSEVCVEWPLPVIFVDPDFHAAEVWVDHQYVWTTTISNLGVGTLLYEFPDYLTDAVQATSQNQLGSPYPNSEIIEDKNGPDIYSGTGYEVVDGFGGPDAFGYSWVDSDEPNGPTYNWIDISATGTVVTGLSDDNIVGPFPIGFTFPFYGEDKTQFWVNSNGTIGFTSTYITLSNYSIPTGNSYVDFIAWFWDDLDPDPPATVYYEDLGGMLVIQFDNYFEFSSTSGNYVDAQMHIYANGGISILYDHIEGSFDVDGGTVGIQSSDNSLGLQVVYNANYIKNGLQVDFKLPTFVVDVDPATALVPEAGSQDVDITWDATGWDVGTHTAYIDLASNDPVTPLLAVGNEMTVVIPAQFAGTVTECEGGAPIEGVTVTAGPFQTMTNVFGEYSLFVDEDSYDVYFEILGMETVMVEDTLALSDEVTPIDVCLYEMPYPVPFVLATVNYPDEDFCDVEWSLPEGPYELSYDDGFADEYFAWNEAGGENAVMFSPSGYPANIFGGRIFVGDGLFPVGDWIGTEFAVIVYGDDGTGLPGAQLDSIGVTVNNYGWVEFYGLDATIEEGDFFMSMYQLNDAPNTAPIGIDNTFPLAYRSYSRSPIVPNWQVSVYQDFMMRAYVDGSQTDDVAESNELVRPPKIDRETASKHFITANNTPFVGMPGTPLAGTTGIIEGYAMNSEDVLYYTVARMSDFDPLLGPETGTMTVLNNVTEVSFVDNDFSGLTMGWYAYAVQVAYSSGMLSPWTFSNIVGRDMDAAVTFEVTQCDEGTPENVEITMMGLDYPFTLFTGVTDETGIFTFEQVWKGMYEVEVFKIGYEGFHWVQPVFEDLTIPIVLSEKKYPVRNVWADPLTSYVYWDPPVVVALDEDFDGVTFPPSGWSASSNGVGWFATMNGSSGWTIPAWDSQYACSNDDAAGSTDDGSVDYLITPPLDLREVDSYHLMFDSYYDMYYGLQIATVEYSFDAGASWTVLYGLTPNAGSWDYIDIDLASLSGLTATTPVWMAFHSDDGGGWASGWAIDNVFIANGETEPIGYHVFLDGALDGITDTTFYQFEYLEFGTTYTACVAAEYSCGLSEQVCVDFTSIFLLPPRNLDGLTFDHTVHVWWNPPIEPATDALISIPAFNGEIVKGDGPDASKEAPYQVFNVETPKPYYPEGLSELSLYGYIGAPSSDQLFEMDMTTYATTLIGGTVADPATGDFANDEDQMMYVGGDWGDNLYHVDVNTGTGTLIGPFTGTPYVGISGMATDRTTGDVYICGTDISSSYIGLLDPATGAVTQIGGLMTTATGLIDIAIDGNGQMYGWCLVTDAAYTIDKTTGVETLLGSLGIDINYGQGGNWDQNNDIIWMTAYNAAAGAELRILDPLTGATTYAGALPESQCAAFGVPGVSSGGGGGAVPENLLGYNLYRDMGNIAYIPYNEEDTTHYFDYNLEPLCYAYDVTAVYDLTPYGFPGETAESMYEGTFDVCVEYGWPLTFIEDWNTGSFDPNLWTAGENWVVNGQFGNPYPCAEFKWDPVLVDYESSLVSYPIDGKYHPGTDDPYIDGRIYFDFDVALDDNGMSGAETLAVEIWDGGMWSTVTSFSNADGNFDWTSYHFEITDHAFGKIFKVRFTAEGANSSGIISWFVDNIVIYRECDAPTDLTAEGIDPSSIELNWSAPAGSGGGGGTAEWIFWDTGVNEGNAIGFGGAAVWSVAQHFDAAQLTAYEGMYITKIRFFAGANSNSSTFVVKVWDGADGLNLVYEQDVPVYLAGDWNEVDLTTPVPIDITKDLWFGYTTEQFTGDDFPAGCDPGPPVPGYGDMINDAGFWWSMATEYPTLQYNFNIHAYVADVTDGAPSLPLVVDNTVHSTPANATPQVNNAGGESKAVSDIANSDRALTGYDIYWDDNGAGFMFLDFTEDTTYLHTVEMPFEVGSSQCYYVTAVYEDCDAASEEACVIATGIDNPALADGIAVYPNPARDILNITSSSDITHVTVMNYVGQVVYNQKVVEDNDLQLSVAGYETGVYIVKVETTAGILTKKVTIAH